jgi:hypothetical protein
MNSGTITRQKAGGVLERMGAKVERYAHPALGILLGLFFVALVGLASTIYLWYDELVVIRVASFPHWHDIWNFYASGLDTIGLLYALLIHPLVNLRVSPEISTRLPAMVAYLAMLLCAFVFVRRRYPAVYAFATLLLLMSLPLLDYAVFAKSYALEFAGVAFAMMCWQSATDGRRRVWNVVGVWLGLVLALYSHTFGIFLMLPFAAAQGVRDYRRKKVDWAVWIAIVTYPVSLLPVLRGDLLASKLYGANFWSQPSSALMKQTYIDYFTEDWRLLLILFLAAVMVTALFRNEMSAEVSAQKVTTGFSLAEWVFVGLLAALPIYVLPPSYLLHAYRADYVMSYAIGLAILLVAVFAEHAKRTQGAGLVLLVLFASVILKKDLKTIPQGLRAMAHPMQAHTQLQDAYDSGPWLKELEASDLPVLAGDHLLYARLECYAPRELKQRLYFVTNLGEVGAYPQSTTSQKNFLLFGKMLSYRTVDVGSFLPEHPHFLMAVSPMVDTLWLPAYVMKQQQDGNASLHLLGPEYVAPNVYDVQFTRMPEFHSIGK